MYEQSLVKTIEPVKKTTISRLNKGKKWKYGYDKEHDIIVISKTGQIGEILEIQSLRVALPKMPVQVFKHEKNKCPPSTERACFRPAKKTNAPQKEKAGMRQRHTCKAFIFDRFYKGFRLGEMPCEFYL